MIGRIRIMSCVILAGFAGFHPVQSFAQMDLQAAISGADELGGARSYQPVGTIVMSILPPRAFFEKVEPAGGWILADGSPLQDQDKGLARFMKLNRNAYYSPDLFDAKDIVSAPNLQGAFLRGIDTRDDGAADRGDPVKKRKIGEYQVDGVGLHAHAAGYTYPNTAHVPHVDSTNTTMSMRRHPDYAAYPRGSTDPAGSSETRPKNIAIFYYIRVK